MEGSRMAAEIRIGLISDTHGLLRPEVFDRFAGVHHIVHAGDVGDEEILIELEAIAPVTAVWGNTDGSELRSRLPEMARVELNGLVVVALHGQQFGSPTAGVVGAEHPAADLVVFGHSHRPEIERVGRTLAVNPGSAGPARFTLPVTVAVATIGGGTVRAEIVALL
jgi:uncharacterized protein